MAHRSGSICTMAVISSVAIPTGGGAGSRSSTREGEEATAEALMFRIRRFSEHDVTLESVR